MVTSLQTHPFPGATGSGFSMARFFSWSGESQTGFPLLLSGRFGRVLQGHSPFPSVAWQTTINGTNSNCKSANVTIHLLISGLCLVSYCFRHDIEVNHDFVLHLYRSAGRRIGPDAVVALFERVFAGGAELLRRDGRRDRNRDSLRHSVQRQIAVHDEAVRVIAGLLHVADRD